MIYGYTFIMPEPLIAHDNNFPPVGKQKIFRSEDYYLQTETFVFENKEDMLDAAYKEYKGWYWGGVVCAVENASKYNKEIEYKYPVGFDVTTLTDDELAELEISPIMSKEDFLANYPNPVEVRSFDEEIYGRNYVYEFFEQTDIIRHKDYIEDI